MAYLWKLAAFIAGMVFMIIGYKLFMKGFIESKTNANINLGGYRFGFKDLAPGSFFALLGAVIIVVSITDNFSYTGADGTRHDEMEFTDE